MKKLFSVVLVLVILTFIWQRCSENKNPLPSKTHPESWMQSTSPNFHGEVVLTLGSEAGLNSCKSCHGDDFKGGRSKTSCYKCHASFPHPDDWLIATSAGFHGSFLKQTDWNAAVCKDCHGADYSGGTAEVSCFKCHVSYPHREGWMVQGSNEFHGLFVIAMNWSLVSCQKCHGNDFQGGMSGISCLTCHSDYPHVEGWALESSSNFHGQYIRQAGWSMASCKTCHGDDYKGGKSGSSCYDCHQETGGPEACNTCHGSAQNAAPPKDLSGNTETTAIGVGAHQFHYGLYQTCAICHSVPTSFSDPNHIDNTPNAEVLAYLQWDRTTATCVSSCHPDPNKSYIWNNF